ncbi:hypothetical protein Rleg_5924 (plasmid) [Rhizobium leguminosarum bv. trifolii WSM1325]|uniref:Uncharacterized protein n=1 Tax=Rhizobium leguminosarum bv. trifolii (strain WSM1325) TaxID=395491 RepID=C6B8F6_RHILS|nr:hypothetical protein [Rhizobium leguminosarum]ACS60688.1 hypothetical protein Rleg_5924 [Rhizobium leguminosarum bv. trifolii WSM1325]
MGRAFNEGALDMVKADGDERFNELFDRFSQSEQTRRTIVPSSIATQELRRGHR